MQTKQYVATNLCANSLKDALFALITGCIRSMIEVSPSSRI